MRVVSTLAGCLCLSGLVFGQAMAQNPFAGGTPSGQPVAGSLALTLSDALDRGLKYNLGVVLGQQGTRTAEAARLRAIGALLPNVGIHVSELSQQLNLAALGFTGFPGIPQILGPFNVVDTRATVTSPVLDLAARYGTQAGSAGVKAAQASYEDARDVVVLVVGNLYLRAVAGQARIETVRAQLATAEALYQRAADMKKAGVVPAIDVLRAQVEMQSQQQRLIYYRNEFEKQKLELARAIGLALGQQFELAGRLSYSAPPSLGFEQALEDAYRTRSDYRGAQALLSAAESARRAARAQRYPTVSVEADYGDIGPGPQQSHGTYTAGASLNIPVFQGERVNAAVLEADALVERRRAELEDLRGAIQYQVRTAFLDLAAASDQVKVAESAKDLAGQELAQAQDRFTAGVVDNLEVVQAQQAVAIANENYIDSLYAYSLGKVSLARSLGGADQKARQFLGAQ
ncbi:MAG: TolC family protein [Bryobacteraceae bacterium]